MTTILLDTNAYLRLAKRIRPVLGCPFGAKKYVLLILREVEKEVLENQTLTFQYPWFTDDEHQSERRSKGIRLTPNEKTDITHARQFLLSYSTRSAQSLMTGGRSPPGSTDCYVLAVAQTKGWIVATDDEGMHAVGREFDIPVFYCFDVLKKMLSSKLIDSAKVIEIYDALERNNDLTKKWVEAKVTHFSKVFRLKTISR